MGKVFGRQNKEGKIRWYVCVTYHGQRYREVAGDKKSVALRRLRELEDRLDRGGKLQDPKVPFDVLCGEYLEWASVNLAPRTRREREIIIRAHLKPFFTCLTGEIGVKEIEMYKASRDEAGIAGTTLNTELKIISCILRYGVELGYLLELPKIRRVRVSRKNRRFLTKEEIFKVLDAAHPDRRPLLQLMIFTGLRKGELAHLEWSDIDFGNRVLHVQPKEGWNPKSGDPRTIPLNNHALDALKQARSAKEGRGDPRHQHASVSRQEGPPERYTGMSERSVCKGGSAEGKNPRIASYLRIDHGDGGSGPFFDSEGDGAQGYQNDDDLYIVGETSHSGPGGQVKLNRHPRGETPQICPK